MSVKSATPAAVSRMGSSKARLGSAQSRVESLMRAESRLSGGDRPPMEEGETKGQYAWRMIRQSVRFAIDATLKADAKDLHVGHGIHHSRKLTHTQPIIHMLYNKNDKEYVTLDGTDVRVFLADGRKKDTITSQEPFNRLLYASQVGLYVGWNYNQDKLILMNSSFEVSSQSQASGPILAAVYNENIGEVVTVGPDFMTSWVFRYGGRHILPRRTTTVGLTGEDFNLLVLEETASRLQRAFAANDRGVAVFNLYEGRLLSHKRELHTRAITAILFFNPLKYLITGAKDGSIKVWDEKWHLQLVFVGHGGAISGLAVYPFGPNIISASHDLSLRVWSLETCDQVNKVDVPQALETIGSIVNHDSIYSFSGSHADLWQVRHVHALHSRVGQRTQLIKATDHPDYPTRNLLLCKDSSVRILSPTSGDILTTLLMDRYRHLVDAAYAVAQENLFAVFGNGDILKCDTKTNPCTVLNTWPCGDPRKACNYLLVYEYVISAEIEGDTWGGMKRAIATKGLAGSMTPVAASPGAKTDANRTLLLGGRKDGHICVFNWDTGKIEFEIEAHGTKGVLSMVGNSKADQLISAGLDNIIKVWRLFPYAQESLAPLMSFYCAHTPIHMTVLRHKLAVAFQEHTSATYSVVMYNIRGKNRLDHGPEEDHMDSITGLSSCQKLKLLASSSSDGTVRIWNENNLLCRVIQLNASPSSVCFCSQKGDLLVGIGDHVHKIDYKQYMPKAYRMKMVSMKFPATKEEKSLPFDENLLNMMNREDVKRLKAARSSFKFTHFMDLLTDAENDEVMKEKKQREKAFSLLEKRDSELMKIKEGELAATRKPKPTNTTKREAFNKYLKIFYNRPKIELPPDDPYPEDTFKELIKEPEPQEEEKWIAEKEPTGFFPPPAPAKPQTAPEEPEMAAPVRAGGFIPNSVLAHLLFPQSSFEERAAEEAKRARYVPPKLTEAQMQQVNVRQKSEMTKRRWKHAKKQLIPKTPKRLETGSTFEDRTLVMDYDDPEELQRAAEEEEERRRQEEEDAEAEREPEEFDMTKGSSLLSKVQGIMEREPTPVSEPEETAPASFHSQGSRKSSLSRDESKGAPPTTTAAKPAAKGISFKPKKQVMKYIAPKPPPPREPSPLPTPSRRVPTPVRSPTPPPPPTPIPEFIAQFKGLDWFEKYFPNCNEHTLPKPWSVSSFVTMLARVLRIAEYGEKIHVLSALMTIHTQVGIPNPEPVYKTLYGVFAHHVTPPSCLVAEEKEFIVQALEVMHTLGAYDRDFYVELMVQFMEADKQVRQQVEGLWKACGLKDPHHCLSKELDSWDVWNLSDKERPQEIRRMCHAWLDKWMTSFKIHVEDSIDRLKKGQGVTGRLSAGQLQKPGSSSRSILRKPDVDSIEEEMDPSHLDGVQSMTPGGRMTVTFERPPDISTLESATYMEAMNYFCEMTMDKLLEGIRAGKLDKSGEVKNTVLVLPKVTGKGALVRLGETHTSKCRPHRETAYAADLKLPPVTTRGRQPPPGQLYGFPSAINLPMKQVLMNPFPCPLDDFDPYYQQPVLLTLQTSQKYFVPSRSIVPQDAY